MSHTELSYVNINGAPVDTRPREKAKRTKPEKPAEFHKGWRVVGIPPGALEDAEKKFHADASYAQSKSKAKKPAEPWSAERWLGKARRRAVRAKPYEVPEAAKLCAEMAEKEGWLRVEVRELKSAA